MPFAFSGCVAHGATRSLNSGSSDPDVDECVEDLESILQLS